MVTGSPVRPPWMRVGYFWSHNRIAHRFRIRALRPILSVGSRTTTAFCSGEDTDELRLIRPLRDSDLVTVALLKYVAQRICLWVSRNAGANSLLRRWMRISRSYCVGAPWRHWEGSLAFLAAFLLYGNKGWAAS